MFRLVVKAEIRPTEDRDKVLIALKNILPDSHVEIQESDVKSVALIESDSVRDLIRLHDLLRKERILDAARRSLSAGLEDFRLDFGLSKQAAFVGRISFCGSDDEAPLGQIQFSIMCSDPARLVEWLAPKTSHGRPLQELNIPSFNQ